jgi:hypothetical protein
MKGRRYPYRFEHAAETAASAKPPLAGDGLVRWGGSTRGEQCGWSYAGDGQRLVLERADLSYFLHMDAEVGRGLRDSRKRFDEVISRLLDAAREYAIARGSSRSCMEAV